MLCMRCGHDSILQQAVSTVSGGEYGASVETRNQGELGNFLLTKTLSSQCLWSSAWLVLEKSCSTKAASCLRCKPRQPLRQSIGDDAHGLG
jgi:hypothetical protein